MPNDIFKVVALLQRPLELDNLFFGTMASDSGANVGQQLLVVPWLLDEVLRACTNRVDHVTYRTERGDHDDRQPWLYFENARQKLDSRLPRQSKIEQQQVVLIARKQIQATAPSAAGSTANPSSVSSVSSDSRIACSSSMMRIAALLRCGQFVEDFEIRG